jgi:imidazolonepropionase-like amidohydrolase
VEAVHAVGGRVAVHSQQAAGGAAAVKARVDSLEHGMCLDPGLLSLMAAQGTALTPTLSVITDVLTDVRQRPDGPRKDWYLAGPRCMAGSPSRPPKQA